jgi:tetratricopeptide (TPR) repeat protein
VLLLAVSCRPEQQQRGREEIITPELTIPDDCKAALTLWIDSQQIRERPEAAVGDFHRLSIKYSYRRDSLTHALMRCYEGQAWDVIRQPDSMLNCYEEAGLFLEAHPEYIDLRMMSYLFSGWAHYYKGQRLTANYYFNKAGNEFDDTVYLADGSYVTSKYKPEARAGLLLEITQHARDAGLREQAELYIEKAMASLRKIPGKRPDLEAFAAIEAGTIYSKWNDSGRANRYFRQSLPLVQQLGDTTLLIAYYDNRATSFLAAKQHDSALQYYLRSLELEKETGASDEMLMTTRSGIAAAHSALGNGMAAARAFEATIPFLYGDTTVRMQERAEFARFYLRHLLQGTRAIAPYDRFLADIDSVFNQQRIQAISDMDAQYGLRKKEARIGRLNDENRFYIEESARQKTLLLVAILVILILAVGVAWYRQYQRQKSLIAERDKAVLEQQLLRSQMEPHFMFNTIAVLQSLIRKDEKELSVKYLSHFARLLRISLENARQAWVPLGDELDALEHYLSLQQLRFQNVFEYEFDLFDEYEDERDEVLVPPMLLQPFVENAIQHGMAGRQDGSGVIRVQIRKSGKMLDCRILDNGLGAAAPSVKDPAKKSSLSTTITRERLQIIGRELGQQASVETQYGIEADGSGTEVRLQIPFQEG